VFFSLGKGLKDIKGVGCGNLSVGNFSLGFGNKKISLKAQTGEITKKMGFYTSLRSKGYWYDSSSSAVWGVRSYSEKNLEIFLKWAYLPIEQLWKISVDNDCIYWNITMTVHESIEVDRCQTNIMVSEKYSEWFTESQKGVFPSFLGGIDDDWQVIHSSLPGSDKKHFIGLAGKRENGLVLPFIRLFTHSKKGKANILNSDLYHRGRLLQYLESDKLIIEPGEYEYFKGDIVISEGI
jgi:hypothetical protein